VGFLFVTNSQNAMINAMNWILMVNRLFHFGVVDLNVYGVICCTFCPSICMFQFQNSPHFNGMSC